MREQDWLASTRVDRMLDFLKNGRRIHRSKKGRRKLRLFACSCCRSILYLLEADHPGRLFLEGAERHADGLLDSDNWAKAERAYYEWFSNMADRRDATLAFHSLGQARACDAAVYVVLYTGRVLDRRQPNLGQQARSGLLRHIVGNPFSTEAAPPVSPGCLSTAVTELARSLYQGEDCAFVLHDALLEAGHPDLAEHFRREEWHPKGCWLLDAILGKK